MPDELMPVNLWKAYGLTLTIILVGFVAGLSWARIETKTVGAAANLTRACFPKIGDVALTLEATTGADADSGALNMNSLYMMSCDTDAWVRFGAAAVTAAADDWRCRAGEVYFVPTGGEQALAHISALSVSSDGDVRLIECM